MNKIMPIGIEDYTDINDYYYVDKTLLIKEIIDKCKYRSVLITRPRRFGKSLALSTIDYFFTNKGDYSSYFIDKLIYKEGRECFEYINKYPVIHCNMKDLTKKNYEELRKSTINLISTLYRKYNELENSEYLLDIEKREFIAFRDMVYDDLNNYSESLKKLSYFLYKHYKKRVIILIDEYDTPINSSYQNGYYLDAIDFFRTFYSSALKGNEILLFSVVTGVLEISKESIFSELNNLDVYSVVDDDFLPYFGFDENETKKIIFDLNLDVDIKTLHDWYGGYGKSDYHLYNPWSISCYANKKTIKTYWVNTGKNQIVSDIINSVPSSIESLNVFLNSDEQTMSFKRGISFHDFNNNLDALFSLLVQSGYLKATFIATPDKYKLSIPNLEIREVFENEIIARNISDRYLDLAKRFRNSLLKGNQEEISFVLEKYIFESYSYYDLKQEKDYQNVVVALLAVLFEDYIVKSEVNNKNGRCDIMVSPKNANKIGMIIEIKNYNYSLSDNRFKEFSNAAINQIKKNAYYSELMRKDVSGVLLYSFVFAKNGHYIAKEFIDNSRQKK